MIVANFLPNPVLVEAYCHRVWDAFIYGSIARLMANFTYEQEVIWEVEKPAH